MKKLIMIVAVMLSAALVIPWIVGAQTTGFPDPDDTKGQMDVKRVVFKEGNAPKWTFVTFSTWTAQRMWDRGFAVVNIDTFGKARHDYYALIRSNGSRMVGELWRDRSKKSDYKVADLKAWKKNKGSVTVKVPLGKMRIGKNRLFYRWVAKTMLISDNCPAVCIDRIPDQGLVQTLLPGVEPSPTVDPTPTPDPEPTETESP